MLSSLVGPFYMIRTGQHWDLVSLIVFALFLAGSLASCYVLGLLSPRIRTVFLAITTVLLGTLWAFIGLVTLGLRVT